MARTGAGGSTRRTVLIAGGANVIVAAAKLAAGLLTGSSALLAAFGIFIAGAGFSVFEGLLTLRHGLVVAAGGLVLQQLTGSPVWDGGASIAIGVLLVVVAFRLGLDSKDLLIGESADPRVLQLIRDEICGTPGIDTMLDLLTMHLGPDHLIVAARVALDDEISADRAEDLADEIDRRLADKLPVTPHVFIDPTQTAQPARQ